MVPDQTIFALVVQPKLILGFYWWHSTTGKQKSRLLKKRTSICSRDPSAVANKAQNLTEAIKMVFFSADEFDADTMEIQKLIENS